MTKDQVRALKADEGVRMKPYLDTATPPRSTIGIGRNLTDKGISFEEAEYLFLHDLLDAEKDASKLVANWNELNDVRRGVLVNMAFNLGKTRLILFRKMLAAVEAGDYELAAKEMLDSKWATQVGRRAVRLAAEMRTGAVA